MTTIIIIVLGGRGSPTAPQTLFRAVRERRAQMVWVVIASGSDAIWWARHFCLAVTDRQECLSYRMALGLLRRFTPRNDESVGQALLPYQFCHSEATCSPFHSPSR